MQQIRKFRYIKCLLQSKDKVQHLFWAEAENLLKENYTFNF